VTAADVVVTDVTIPESMSGSDAADFAAMIEVRNTVETAILGSDALSYSADELLPMYADQTYTDRRLFLGRLDGVAVGRATTSWSRTMDSPVCSLNVEVVERHRARGVGTALLTHAERLATGSGHTVLQTDVMHPVRSGGRRLASPSGFGDVSADDAGVRFLLAHGYDLQIIARASFLDLPAEEPHIHRHREAAITAAGAGYVTHSWVGTTPERWLGGLAHLKTRMIVEEPSAGLDVVAETWDVQRVRARDDRIDDAGRMLLTTVVEELDTHGLVGFTELDLPADRSRPVAQSDTLVLPEHRGHRLGMLLKVRNLEQLRDVNPASRLVYTFNAEENRHMLDVNEALGFRSVGIEGSWRKQA
jgi:GNAT superfamily N-acetyltransferase